MRPRCEYPVPCGLRSDTCDAPAVWETQDLAEIHHLCQEHVDEALQMNDFRTDPVSS